MTISPAISCLLRNDGGNRGNLSVPDENGTLAAAFLPGSAEWGVSVYNNPVANDTFFPDVWAGFKWAVDDKLAFVHIQGVG